MKNKNVVPNLRFPEFRGAIGWILKEVGDIFKITRGEVLSMSSVVQKATKEYSYPVYSSQTKNYGLAGFYSNYLFENAITWTTDGANAGDVNYRIGKFYCTNVCGVLINNDGYANKCIAELINSVSRKYVSYVGNPKLMNGVMSKISIPLPSIPEQQKIADCLSSLDDLITAHTKKLEHLKTHKKGLMQQLFPAEGETVPKLRFPEFREAGEWEKRDFEEVFDIIDGDRGVNYPKEEDFSNSGYCLFLSAKNVTKNGFVFDDLKFISLQKDQELRKGRLKKLDIILTTRGSIGNFAFFSENIKYQNMRINSGMVILRKTKKDILEHYFYVYTQSEAIIGQLEKTSFGSAQPQLTVAQIKKFKILLPSLSEQQKIADCLLLIDARITAQTQKIEALKLHKKGLMQQLFPTTDEVEA